MSKDGQKMLPMHLTMKLGVDQGRFPFGQKFWLKILGIQCDEWNTIFRLVEPTRTTPSAPSFMQKYKQ